MTTENKKMCLVEGYGMKGLYTRDALIGKEIPAGFKATYVLRTPEENPETCKIKPMPSVDDEGNFHYDQITSLAKTIEENMRQKCGTLLTYKVLLKGKTQFKAMPAEWRIIGKVSDEVADPDGTKLTPAKRLMEKNDPSEPYTSDELPDAYQIYTDHGFDVDGKREKEFLRWRKQWYRQEYYRPIEYLGRIMTPAEFLKEFPKPNSMIMDVDSYNLVLSDKGLPKDMVKVQFAFESDAPDEKTRKDGIGAVDKDTNTVIVLMPDSLKKPQEEHNVYWRNEIRKAVILAGARLSVLISKGYVKALYIPHLGTLLGEGTGICYMVTFWDYLNCRGKLVGCDIYQQTENDIDRKELASFLKRFGDVEPF